VFTSISTVIATEHIADLRRAADWWRTGAGPSPPVAPALTPSPPVGLRLAGSHDTHLVARLAALDDAPELEGPVLLALINDQAVAGLSLLDGRVIANPFVATSEAVALLRLRAEHLSGRRARRRLRTILRPKLA
jgi:hypothetical protein